MKKQFNEKLKEFRDNHLKTQAEMSDILGISERMYSYYEQGKYYGTAKKVSQYLQKLADYESQLSESTMRFQESKSQYQSAGYLKNNPVLSSAQQSSVMLATSASTYAALELLCRVVAKVEDAPLEDVRKEANQLTHERLKSIEDVLSLLVSLP